MVLCRGGGGNISSHAHQTGSWGSFIFIRLNLLISLKYTDQMVHDTESIEKGSGENLAYFQPGDPANMPTQCQGPKDPSCVQCREMVADWYAEEPNFDYDTGQSKGGAILHFTQVVWKETTELGMATATSADTWLHDIKNEEIWVIHKII